MVKLFKSFNFAFILFAFIMKNVYCGNCSCRPQVIEEPSEVNKQHSEINEEQNEVLEEHSDVDSLEGIEIGYHVLHHIGSDESNITNENASSTESNSSTVDFFEELN